MRTKETLFACALAAAIAVAPLVGCGSKDAGGSGADGSAGASQEGQQAEAASDETAGDDLFVLYLGTNDKDTNEPVYSREESMKRAKAILMKDFGGYTIQEAEGGWKGDDGKEYQEYTLVIYLSDTDIDKVHAAAREMIEEFHQSSVLINTERVQTEFYAGE